MKLTLTAAAREAALSDLPAGAALRIAFAGGCGAMGFRLAPSRRGDEDDTRLEVDGVTVLLDRKAAMELDGAELDHDPDEGFVIDHPDWGQSC